MKVAAMRCSSHGGRLSSALNVLLYAFYFSHNALRFPKWMMGWVRQRETYVF